MGISVADSARIIGEIWAGQAVRVAQGTIIRSGGSGGVRLGHGSMVLENSVVIGSQAQPAVVGQKTVFGHKCVCMSAQIGDLCEVGNGTIFMPGAKVGDRCIFGEGTIVPPGAEIPADSVVVGRPGRVIRKLTAADLEMISRMRGGDTSLRPESYTTAIEDPKEMVGMGKLYGHRGKFPTVDATARICETAELTGDVVVGAGSVIASGVKIIGDSHGPVRIGANVHILENTVLHLLPDNELIIADGVTIAPNCIIHGTTIGAGTIVEPGSIVCDYSRVGRNVLIKAGSLVKQRDVVADNVVVEGFPAKQTGENAIALERPVWAFRQLTQE